MSLWKKARVEVTNGVNFCVQKQNYLFFIVLSDYMNNLFHDENDQEWMRCL